jgi:very-short-patch-repair endonuclease
MKKHLEHYNETLIPIARVLRKQMTDAERKLWSLLRGNRLGIKFRRQAPISNYIVDFFCVKAKLIIELDGNQHYMQKGIQNDFERDEYLHSIGYKVIRYPNSEIFENEDGMMQEIFEHVRTRTNDFLDPL